MKLEEIKNEAEYKLYLDVDGVFADFDKWALENVGIHPDDSNSFWDAVKKHMNDNPDKPVWGALELKHDAKALWDYVKHLNPTFLTSTGNWQVEKADKEKREWLAKHFPGFEVITVSASRLKAKYANKNAILVDDRMKSIGPWNDAGGVGILHKTAEDTIKHLKSLGL